MKSLMLFLALLFCHHAVANRLQYSVHEMQPGDTISEVLQNNGLTPLYGQKQKVEEVLKLNRLTQQKAKTLEKGEVIVIPIASKKLLEDSVKNSLSSVTSVKRDIKIPASNHQFQISTEYFFAQYSLADSSAINVSQNFAIELKYEYRPHNEWSPFAAVKVLTQSGAQFSSTSLYRIEFTPSPTAIVGLAHNWMETKISGSLFSQYEYRGHMDMGIFYDVRKDHLLWLGGSLSKEFVISKIPLKVGIDVATTVYTLNAKSINPAQKISINRLSPYLGVTISKKFPIKLYIEQQEITATTKTTLTSVGFSAGILF